MTPIDQPVPDERLHELALRCAFRSDTDSRDISTALTELLSLRSRPSMSGVRVNWHRPEELPTVAEGSEAYFVLALYRKESDKVFSFPAKYLNGYPLIYEDRLGCGGVKGKECPDDGSHDDGCPTTGWFYESSEGEYDTNYLPINLQPGDRIEGWTDVPRFTPSPAASAVEAEGAGDLTALRKANVARQAIWCPDEVPDLSFRGNELSGEVGEACNVIKKLERERHNWRGSRDTVEHLAEELADVVICADLCAITAGIDLAAAVVAKFNATSDKVGIDVHLATPSAPAGSGEGEQHG